MSAFHCRLIAWLVRAISRPAAASWPVARPDTTATAPRAAVAVRTSPTRRTVTVTPTVPRWRPGGSNWWAELVGGAGGRSCCVARWAAPAIRQVSVVEGSAWISGAARVIWPYSARWC